VSVYVALGERTSPIFCQAFAKGCRGDVVDDRKLRGGEVALFGSPKLWGLLEDARADGRTIYYGDHGYFGRGRYFRVTRNALQHDGRGGAGPERFSVHDVPVKPWRKSGGHILVVPQSDTYFYLRGEDPVAWKVDVQLALRKQTDRPIRWRPTKWLAVRPFEQDLKDCHAVVCFTSNAAVEAVLAGVPAFVTENCAAATMGNLGLQGIEHPRMPAGREQWAWNLAANQWTIDEIRRGDAWRALCKD